MQEHQQESFLVDVHGCGHIMRILRGLNEKENVYFMVIRCASKMGEKGWKLDENGTFGQNVQTRNGKNMV